jgi:spoIIIJ-associated protein
MRDLLFSGKDVEEAVALACQVLGLTRSGLRYVVLEEGAPGRFGGSPTTAQIAVLLDRPQPGRPGPESRDPQPPAQQATPEQIVGSLQRAAGLDLQVSSRDGAAGTEIEMAGPDAGFLLQDDAAVLRALEHLLQRVAQQQGLGRVTLNCEGYREWRDDSLRRQALALAADVLRDGQGRTTGPLNSYERRVVHLAIEAVDGVTTRSVGEGSERRVTVAPADAAPAGRESTPATEP